MAWLRSEKIKDGQVSVNTKIFDIKHGLVEVENPEDIRIFCQYLHFEVIPDELAKKLIEEAEGQSKGRKSRGGAGEATKKDGAKG